MAKRSAPDAMDESLSQHPDVVLMEVLEMDVNTGRIFESVEEARAAGVAEQDLATGSYEALEKLQRRFPKPKRLRLQPKKRRERHPGEACS